MQRHRLAVGPGEQQHRPVGTEHVGQRVEEGVGPGLAATEAANERLEPVPHAHFIEGRVEREGRHGSAFHHAPATAEGESSSGRFG